MCGELTSTSNMGSDQDLSPQTCDCKARTLTTRYTILPFCCWGITNAPSSNPPDTFVYIERYCISADILYCNWWSSSPTHPPLPCNQTSISNFWWLTAPGLYWRPVLDTSLHLYIALTAPMTRNIATILAMQKFHLWFYTFKQLHVVLTVVEDPKKIL